MSSLPGYVWRPSVAPPITDTDYFWQTSTNTLINVVIPPLVSINRFSKITFNQYPAKPPATFVPPNNN